MTNQTQQYAQKKLQAAQEALKPYGIDLGLKNIQSNTIRVINVGVGGIKNGAVSSRRYAQKTRNVHVGEQEYYYPLRKPDGTFLLDEEGKKVKVLMRYSLIKQVDPGHAEDIRTRLANQAEGLLEKVKQMEEI